MVRKYLLIMALGTLAACSSVPDEAAKALAEKGVLDVLRDASDDKYDPPADGKLTAPQLEMYLRVRKREIELAKAAADELKAGSEKLEKAKDGGGLSAAWEGLKTLGSAGDLLTVDIRAAQELGENTAEYIWVKGKVIEVGAAALMEKNRKQLAGTFESQLERMKEARAKATTDQMKQAYDAQISALEKALGDSEEEAKKEASDEAVAYNRELLSRYQDEMVGIDSELQKYRLFGQQ